MTSTPPAAAAPSTRVRVRPLDPAADSAALARVQEAAWEGAYAALHSPADMAVLRAAWKDGRHARQQKWMRARPGVTTLVAELLGAAPAAAAAAAAASSHEDTDTTAPQPCGYIRVGAPSVVPVCAATVATAATSAAPPGANSSWGEVLALNVHPWAWGLGVGSALMEAGVGELRRQGYASALLWAVGDNVRARRFYQRAGWRCEESVVRRDESRDMPLTEICFTRSLADESTNETRTAATIAPAAAAAAAAAGAGVDARTGANLILHLDINGTVTPIDSVDREEPDDLIGMFLSKYSFGHRDATTGRWQLDHTSALEPASECAHSYYDFVRNNCDMTRADTYGFAREGQPGESMAHLVSRLREYYAPAATTAVTNPTDASANDAPSPATSASASAAVGPLFPSFVRVLHRYPRAKIIFRTFGHDGPRIVSAVQRELRQARLPPRRFQGFKLHRGSAGPALPRLDGDAGKDEAEVLELEPLDDGVDGDDDAGTTHAAAPASAPAAPASASPSSPAAPAPRPRVVGSVSSLGSFLDGLAHDAWVQDDYAHWDAQDRLARHGKPIFAHGEGAIVIAIDDNECMQLPATTQGAAAAGAAALAAAAAASSPPARAHFVRVNPVLAMQHTDYFEQIIDGIVERTQDAGAADQESGAAVVRQGTTSKLPD